MFRLFLALICTAALCLAADVTGNWTGTLSLNSQDLPGYLVLKQDGAKITGSAGPDKDHLVPLTKGSIDDAKLVVEAQPGPATLRLVLTAAGDGQTLQGDVYENDQKIGTASLHRDGQ